MSASNQNSPFNDPSYSRERLELETRVLAAALRQSLEIGDTEGSSLAHEQIFLLLKASQEMVMDEPINLPREVFIDRGRQLPDIDWGGSDEKSSDDGAQTAAGAEGQQYHVGDFTPPGSSGAQVHDGADMSPDASSRQVTTNPDLDRVEVDGLSPSGQQAMGQSQDQSVMAGQGLSADAGAGPSASGAQLSAAGAPDQMHQAPSAQWGGMQSGQQNSYAEPFDSGHGLGPSEETGEYKTAMRGYARARAAEQQKARAQTQDIPPHAHQENAPASGEFLAERASYPALNMTAPGAAEEVVAANDAAVEGHQSAPQVQSEAAQHHEDEDLAPDHVETASQRVADMVVHMPATSTVESSADGALQAAGEGQLVAEGEAGGEDQSVAEIQASGEGHYQVAAEVQFQPLVEAQPQPSEDVQPQPSEDVQPQPSEEVQPQAPFEPQSQMVEEAHSQAPFEAQLQSSEEAQAPGDEQVEAPGDEQVEAPNDAQLQHSSDAQLQHSSDAQPQAPAEHWAAPPASAGGLVINDAEEDYYRRLNVTDLADFHSIHLAFWRMMRLLLRQEVGLVGPERANHIKRMQRLWIAHDILCDPVTRADYDFRKMGVRGGDTEDDAVRTFHRGSGPRTQLRIGELLQCAGLLEQNELDIAADMHKAMPEMMFGTFLVKQGFVEDSDLNCVLVGQQLLKAGDITVVQFQTVMIERSATGLDIGEMLLAKGYVNQAMLDRAYRNQSEDTLVKMPAIVLPGMIVANVLPGTHEAEPAANAVESATSQGASAPTAQGASAVGQAADQAVNAGGQAADQAVSAPAEESEPVAASGHIEAAPASPGFTARAERTFNLANAAPAWKDQLDWSSPDTADDETQAPAEAAPPAVQKQSPRTISAAAPRAVPTKEAMDDALSASVRAIADIWSEPAQPPPDLWAPEEPPASGPSGQSFVAANDGAHGLGRSTVPPNESASAPGAHGEGFSTTSGADHQQSFSQQYPAAPPQDEQPSPGLLGGVVAAAEDQDVFSEIETAGQLPSLGELERRAQEKEGREAEVSKRATGDWQIMSVPGSALTSLFLDEAPEPTPQSHTIQQQTTQENAVADDENGGKSGKDPLQTKEITGNMLPFVDEDDLNQTAAEPMSQAPPPTPAQAAQPEHESRRARRRRTRH